MTNDPPTTGQPINAVVIGVGRMGQHHARNYAAIPGFKLVGVVDSNPENAQKAAQAYACRAFASWPGSMLGLHDTPDEFRYRAPSKHPWFASAWRSCHLGRHIPVFRSPGFSGTNKYSIILVSVSDLVSPGSSTQHG